jgi:glycosyltransferase involved in cell wall biosynthesis
LLTTLPRIGQRKMRVLHVIGTLRAGGAETLVRELLPRFVRRGVDVAAYSGYDPRLTADERADLTYPVFEGAKSGHFDVGFASRTVAAIRRFAPDIVHTHTVTGKYWGRACALAGGVKFIVHTEHSPRERLPLWERPLARILAPRTNVFITFSQRNAEQLAKREFISRTAVIPNGIEIEPAPTETQRRSARESLGAANGLVVIGVVANLAPQKNQRLAIEAFARAAGRQRARLDLFGAGPELDALQRLAAELGVAHAVRFWGFRSDIRALLPGLDIFLSVATIEAAPISFLEAMSAGVPILGTPHNGTLDFVDDGVSGFVIRDWSVASVADALDFAVADVSWRAKVGSAARRHIVEQFDIERTADRHVELYETLLASKSM